jgi:uncharacterized repeat protein (TIGR01451 family)
MRPKLILAILMKIFSARDVAGLKLRTGAAMVCLLVAAASPRAWAVEGISSNALHQIESLIEEKSTRSPAQRKLDSQLIHAIRQAQGLPMAPGVATLRTNVMPDASGRVEVDLKAVVSPELLDAIQQLGGVIVNSAPNFGAIRARIPVGKIEDAAALPAVRSIRRAVQPEMETGALTSEGDVTQTADLARNSFLVDGSDVKVGVLSDSLDFLSQSQATGDAPQVTVLPGQGGFGSGEGTAMVEIIHDLAPGAQIYFATAGGGVGNFAQNILGLRAAGCSIIVDDVRYATESPLQDDTVAQAVNAVTADGAMYFASAGNSGNKNDGTSGTWEGDFVDGGAVGTPVNGRGGNIHSFGANTYNAATGFGGSVGLFWADPLGASTNDYDLFLVDDTGNTILDSSTAIQNGTQDPLELMGFVLPGERIIVVKVSGDARFLHIDTGRGSLTDSTDGFARGHSAASNALATAAVDVITSFPSPFAGGPQNPVETFSSDGPRRIFFQQDGTPITPGNFLATGGYVRQYPVIAASDGVQTTVPGFNPFFGTSAAAPHAAAVAALVKSYNSELTADEIRLALVNGALDIEAPGVDRDSGFGLVMAQAALQAAPPPAPLPRLVISTNFISGGNGNGEIDYNECNELFLVVSNLGIATATRVQVSVSSPTPGVAFGVRTAALPDLAPGTGGTNLAALTMSTAPFFVCGTPIQVNALIKSDQVTIARTFILTTGSAGVPKGFDSTGPVVIPDADPIGTNSTITVSNLVSAVRKVTVSLYLTHTFDSDIYFELIGPDGTTVLLADHNGAGGNNYGASCAPEVFRTTFDDDSQSPIAGGSPPFVGVFKPQAPVSAFVGKAGTNANGNWKLHVVDDVGQDVGIVQCWSLHISTATCIDGGGTCPGSDVAVGLTDAPDPVFIGSNLVYTITVTNFGPSQATNIFVNQLLPPSVVFASAVASQGSVTHAGGTVIGNIGTLPLAGVATINVTVIPTISTVISSSATVGSEQPDPNTANNTASVVTRVNPPSSDVTVGLFDSPDPVLLGETLTYTVAVTNNGPSTASGVTISNTLPVSVLVQSATPSQGTASINGNTVIFNFGTLTNAGRATGTINVTPGAEGSILATAVARANQVDPQAANNTATISTVVGPAADLAVTMVDAPDPVVVRSNWTYTITVTNNGPSSASGAVVNHTLPSGVKVVSTSTSLGTISAAGNAVAVNLGNMAKGVGAVITVTVNTTNTGNYLSTVAATAAQTDAHPEDNTAQVDTLVALPFVRIEGAGATLTAESFAPADGGVSVGETVTVQLRLRNAGNVNNTNLTATLLATGGVASPSPAGAVTYGVLPPGGLPVGQPFTFTASGTNGGTVIATLQLQDGGNNLTNVTFSFTLPTMLTFSNTAAITIPDSGSATPYPSTINVSGVTGLVGRVTATLSNFTHTFPQDVDVLLVAPGGQRSFLMASAGAPFASGVNVTFDDGAASAIPQNGSISSGSYRPASYGSGNSLPAPAPANPYQTVMSVFNGINPNGQWSLYAADRSVGDAGNIAGGWSLTVAVVSPVNQVADLGVLAAVTPNPVFVADDITCVFTITNTGPNTATGVSFTNLVPVGAVLQSATSSHGLVTTNASSVVGSLGTINVGASVTVTVVVRPTVAGVLTLAGYAVSSETDLNPANNTGSANTTVNAPLADLSVAAVASTNAVVVGSNLTFTVSATNLGPQQALSVTITDPLPAGLSFVSTTAGSFTNSAGTVTVSLGNLASGGFSTFDIVANAPGLGTWTNVISGGATSSDTNAANNTVSLTIIVSAPAPIITAASAVLTSESSTPPNATVDIGETVSVSLSLKNVGSADTANLVATLQNSGGVNAASVPQNYGLLVRGGAAVARPYTFTASGTDGGVVVATLQLQDGANNLGTTTFSFNLPGTASFSNAAAITIPGQGSASPYPSTIEVSGLLGVTAKAVVTLNGVTHGFPDDVDIVLVSPTGQKVVLMSDAGGGHGITNRTLKFDDAGGALPDTSTIYDGTYAPTDYEPGDVFPPPAPAGPVGDSLGAFNGADPNGTWSLYVADDSTGDSGSIANGWTFVLTTVSTVNPVTDLEVTLSGLPASLYVGSALTYSIGVINHGPTAATGVTVTDALPPGVHFVSATTSQGSLVNSGGLVTFNLGSLGAAAGATASIRVSPAFGPNVVNSVTVTGNESDLSAINNTAQTTTTVLTPLRASLTDVTVTNAQVQFTLTGDPGMAYVIQGSTNLSTWTALATNTAAVNGTIKFTDTSASGLSLRFYRAIRVIP